jgi:NAD(P)-dependent dehydrogenase (short-subunit alcohol dehydrogenase family)
VDVRILLTGATNGIGLAAAEALCKRGLSVALVARNEDRARSVARRLTATGISPDSFELLVADLASQADVRRLAADVLDRYPRLQVLVNNAGAMYGRRLLSPDGIELTWAVNHLAPFLLTDLLLGRLQQNAPARIVTTASEAHRTGHIPFDDLNAERSYRAFQRYGQTKLANILFTRDLAHRVERSGVSAMCFHPGVVNTGFNRNNGAMMAAMMMLLRPFARTPERGAETLVWLVESSDSNQENGGYFMDKRLKTPSPAALDAAAGQRLWAVSLSQLGRTV